MVSKVILEGIYLNTFFKKVEKNKNSRKIGKIREHIVLEIFCQYFANFVFLITFLKVFIKNCTFVHSEMPKTVFQNYQKTKLLKNITKNKTNLFFVRIALKFRKKIRC